MENIQSGDTPRGLVDSAAKTLVVRVLNSTNASILLILEVVGVTVGRFGGESLKLEDASCLKRADVSTLILGTIKPLSLSPLFGL